MTSSMFARGGTKETRANIILNHTEKVFDKFLTEANASLSPINYKFYSIWEILKLRSLSNDDFVRTTNMAA